MENRARRIATELRSSLGLRGPIDIDQVARELGFHVDEVSFKGPNVVEITIGNSIGVKKGLPERDRRWVIAHGLRHAFLHHPSGNQVWLYVNADSTEIEEKEAEIFALYLLMDGPGLMRLEMGENFEIALYYGVPVTKLRPPFAGSR